MSKRPKQGQDPAEPTRPPVEASTDTGGDGVDDVGNDGKDRAAQSLGRRGGKARAEKMTAERRSEIAKNAARSRWKR